MEDRGSAKKRVFRLGQALGVTLREYSNSKNRAEEYKTMRGESMISTGMIIVP